MRENSVKLSQANKSPDCDNPYAAKIASTQAYNQVEDLQRELNWAKEEINQLKLELLGLYRRVAQ